MTSKLSQSLLLVPLTAASVQVSGELSLSRRRGYKYSPVRGRHGARWVWEGGLQGRNRQENWLKAYLLIRWGGGGSLPAAGLQWGAAPPLNPQACPPKCSVQVDLSAFLQEDKCKNIQWNGPTGGLNPEELWLPFAFFEEFHIRRV